MIETVPMYRVVCDHDGCDATPQDGEYYAWLDRGHVLDEASEADWYIGGVGEHYCQEHAPRCFADGCEIRLVNDDYGPFCEDHAPAETP